jgi:hypothetical protein
MKLWFRNLILRWLGLADHQARLLDLERHFVTKRDEEGMPTETLADVPVDKRKELKGRTAGMSWPQRKRWLEATDGGRRAAMQESLPSTS